MTEQRDKRRLTASLQAGRLENRLVLLGWLNSVFGFKNNADLLADLKEAEEGYDPYGRSGVYHRLVGRGNVQIPAPRLGHYDDNVKSHLSAINARRPEPITLRYFQHLALLYTEVFLDRTFNHHAEFLRELNEFVAVRNANKAPGESKDSAFEESDLNKLAFWMATGSGKTLMLHCNYRQFLHYNGTPLDNILLITPNEGLTEQHIAEMELSDIPCERFNLDDSGLELGARNSVRVIEITKLVEEKKGGGQSVDIEAFEGNNLIFVDEGHKGSGGQAWRRFRDRLGQTGFTFEYSATFGQALTAARKDELTEEYGKAIVFDYSYRYFHGDGYGKDFHILNLRQETTEEKTETLLLGNLLSFFEQKLLFADKAPALRPYNLDQPLWVFVGSSVNAVYSENREKRSDVLTVARFLHHFLKDKNSAQKIQTILDGHTGLVDENGEDVFAGRFEYLRSRGKTAEQLHSEILTQVFHARAGGSLHLCDMRGSAGELGLKVSGSDENFGLIFIGDTSAFKKLVETDDSDIVIEEDVISESLFDGINRPGSGINILIGAKKFMEGWNSWRVSNMGLLNIGRREGSEIIQLFGRGVRLRGKAHSLKRSSALDGEHPTYIRLLETLNIFAVRANYMAQFRDYLEREGIETDGHIELPLAIKPNRDFLKKGLVVPRIPEDRNFARECSLLLQRDRAAKITVDLSLKIQSIQSAAVGVTTEVLTSGQETFIPEESLNLVDWERAYLNLLDYKVKKEYFNLAIQPGVVQAILAPEEPRLYYLIADDFVVKPRTFAEIAVLEDAVLTILKKYVDKFYRVSQERWESQHMVYEALDTQDRNFQNYTVKISRSEKQLIKSVKELIEEGKRIYESQTTELPNIHFDRHLYQPLLIEHNKKVKISPAPLKGSEMRFIENLKRYVLNETNGALADKEVFLLRNLTRGKGVGFFENQGFYPDFILWVQQGDNQRIVFVEPHGMRQEKTYWTSDKARLHERLVELSETWGAKFGLKNVSLDSFIISATPYAVLREHYGDGSWSKEEFADRHILFFEINKGFNCVERLFSSQYHNQGSQTEVFD